MDGLHRFLAAAVAAPAAFALVMGPSVVASADPGGRGSHSSHSDSRGDSGKSRRDSGSRHGGNSNSRRDDRRDNRADGRTGNGRGGQAGRGGDNRFNGGDSDDRDRLSGAGDDRGSDPDSSRRTIETIATAETASRSASSARTSDTPSGATATATPGGATATAAPGGATVTGDSDRRPDAAATGQAPGAVAVTAPEVTFGNGRTPAVPVSPAPEQWGPGPGFVVTVTPPLPEPVPAPSPAFQLPPDVPPAAQLDLSRLRQLSGPQPGQSMLSWFGIAGLLLIPLGGAALGYRQARAARAAAALTRS